MPILWLTVHTKIHNVLTGHRSVKTWLNRFLVQNVYPSFSNVFMKYIFVQLFSIHLWKNKRSLNTFVYFLVRIRTKFDFFLVCLIFLKLFFVKDHTTYIWGKMCKKNSDFIFRQLFFENFKRSIFPQQLEILTNSKTES